MVCTLPTARRAREYARGRMAAGQGRRLDGRGGEVVQAAAQSLTYPANFEVYYEPQVGGGGVVIHT